MNELSNVDGVATETPLVKIQHNERLANASRAAGATRQLNKTDAVSHLNGADLESMLPATRAAIGRELNVSAGPNFVGRIRDAISELAAKPGASVIVDPASTVDRADPRMQGENAMLAAMRGEGGADAAPQPVQSDGGGMPQTGNTMLDAVRGAQAATPPENAPVQPGQPQEADDFEARLARFGALMSAMEGQRSGLAADQQ